ncbi:MAG: preprotein translocase subunit YajC [Candidatus Omnitrophica bacterium]|nr:preprotein translocase subunit YajC [Candidatus Omnitrophota bacterium]
MQANAGIVNFIPLLVIFGIFYFLIIKPQQKKQKDHQEMVKNLKKNDEIITAGGIHGTIVQVKDKTLGVRIDENAKVEIDKIAVAQVKKVR